MKRILALLSIICLLLTTVYTGTLVSVADSGAAVTFVQSFEDESLSLSDGNFSFSSEEARTGSKSLKLVKDSLSSTDNSFAAVFLNAEDELEADTPYIVSFYIKPVTIEGAVELQFFRNSVINSHSGNDSADRINKFNLTSAQISALPADQNGWYKVVVSSEFYKDAAKPYMNFWNCQWDGAATVYLDDITFEPILAPEIEENLIEADTEHWSFGQKYGSAGFDGENIKISGGTGVATFIGKTVKEETIRVKLNSNVTADWAGIAFRNQAEINAIKADGQNAYFYDIGDSYVVQWTTDKLSLKRNYKENNESKWDNIVDAIDFNMQDGKDHTIEIKTTDDSANNKTYIEVYVDGILRLSATDTTTAVKDAGYVQIVASGESDSVTVKGFEIDGLKVEDFVKAAPAVTGNNLVKNTNSWFFNKGWVYDGYTGTTGVKGDYITVSGDYGTALFKGAKLGTNYAELKFKTNLSDNGLAFIGLRNAVTDSDLEANGNYASALSEKANAYVLRVMKTGIALGVRASNGDFTPIGTEYAFESSFDVNAQENTIITRILDDTAANSSDIEVWFNGKCIIAYTDASYAIKPEGFYSVTVADNKNNSDYLTLTSLRYDDDIEDIVPDTYEPATEIKENLFDADSQNWIFGREWAPNTEISNGVLTVTGGTGVATFTGKQVGTQSILFKLATNLVNDWAAISFRNQVSLNELEKNAQSGYFMESGNAYALVFTNDGVSVKVINEKNKWETLGEVYAIDLSDGAEHLYEIVTEDIASDDSTKIKVYVDGALAITATDSQYAVKNAGYVSFVCSNKTDSIKVNGFEILGENLADYQQGAPVVSGTNHLTNESGWYFDNGWVYDGYTGKTGIKDGTITVSGDYGTALYNGVKLGDNYAELKFKANFTDKGMAFIGLRNAVCEEDIEKDKYAASTMSDKANAYILRLWKTGIALGIKGEDGNFKILGTEYKFADDFDINAQENSLITKIQDDKNTNSSRIEVWLNGQRVMVYIDDKNAIKPDGYYSVTVADGKSNKDYLNIISFKNGVTVEASSIVEYVPATQVEENLFNADSQNWIFGREWAPNTGISNGVLTVTGGTGVATFTGKKVGAQSILFKLSTNLKSEWAAVSFRNQVSIRELEKNGQNGYFMSSGNAYALVFTNDGVSLKVIYEKDKWKNLGDTYAIDLSDGAEHLYEIVTEDITERKITKIKVYIDGELCISTTDNEYAVKDAGYVSFVCSNKTDSITVNGFEIVGEKLSTYKQGSPKVSGKNAVSDTAKWYFDKGWVYEGYTGTTGVTKGKITVSGDYGTALYKGIKLGQNYAELKFNTKLTDKGMIFIGLRNRVTEEDIQKDKYAASTMSDKAQGYVIRIMKNSIALGIKGEDGNFKTLGTKYDFNSSFDINAQLNTLTTRILDDVDTNSSRIEVWFNGERVMVYIDEEYAIKKDGYYSITVADGKTNTDSITVTSLKIGSGVLSPQTGDTSNDIGLFVVLFAVLCLGVLTVTVLERNKYEE